MRSRRGRRLICCYAVFAYSELAGRTFPKPANRPQLEEQAYYQTNIRVEQEYGIDVLLTVTELLQTNLSTSKLVCRPIASAKSKQDAYPG